MAGGSCSGWGPTKTQTTWMGVFNFGGRPARVGWCLHHAGYDGWQELVVVHGTRSKEGGVGVRGLQYSVGGTWAAGGAWLGVTRSVVGIGWHG